jgi:hypothetical protein
MTIPTFRKPIDKEANAMASKEVEVLDPTPSVEKLKKSASESVLNRRHFIAALGVAGVAAAGTELVRSGPTALAQQPKPNGYAQADVLNFLLNIKYLKATLYSFMTQGADLPPATFTNLGSGGIFNPPGKVTFTAAGPASSTEITDLFNAMYYDELSELITLRSILGSAVSNRATMNLLGTGATTTTGTQTVTPVQAISLLRMLEDLSASAFAGATIYLTGTNLQYATQALATNGFHAGALRLVAIQAGVPYYSPQILTTSSAGTQSQNSVLASTITGSTTIYNFAPTNPITVGSILTGPGVPPDTTVTSVSPVPVYTGNLSGTTAAPNNIITNVTPLTGSTLTQLQPGMAVAGTGIPTNSIITNITGSTVTIGTVTGYTSLVPATPPFTGGTPVTNGLLGITGTGGVGLTVGTYNLTIDPPPSPGTQAVGTITVLTTGTSTTSATYSIVLKASGSGYITPPNITAATGGSGLVLTPTMPAMITTTTTGATFTQGFVAATNKNTTLTFASPTSFITQGQILSGTGIPSNGFISSINAAADTVTISSNASVTSSVAPTGFVTLGSNVITQVSSVSGILFGMPISGTGIPAAATVSTFDPVGLTITMSAAATLTTTGTSSVAPTALLTAGSNVVTALSSLTGLNVGATVTGTGVPSGTTIASVGSVNTMVLSNNATANSTQTAAGTLTAILQSGNNIVSYVAQSPYASGFPSALKAGVLISDPGNVIIPVGTTVTGVTSSSLTITLSAPATAATTITALQNFTGTVVVSYETISAVTPASVLTSLSLGQPIAGPNIPYGTIITGLPGVTGGVTTPADCISISQFPTAAGGPELVNAALSTLATTTLTMATLPALTVTSKTLSETVTTPTIVTVTPSLGTATISQAATTTGTQTVIVEGTDNMDVEPNDPGTITFTGVVTSGSVSVTGVSSLTGLAVGLQVVGSGIPAGATIATVTSPSTITLSAAATAGGTAAIPLFAYLANSAALASAGPAAIAGTSPAVYGGFFDTASGSTSSAQNPVGSTFARTFSQVLTVLYGSTAAQTFQGGFFPNGVAGGINFV